MMKQILAGAAATVLIVVVAASVSLHSAAASEDVEIGIIGFSEDGRYFAFEEFALQAGSGYPIVSLYIVDLPRDAWVPGTPFRSLGGEFTTGEDEREAYRFLAEARARMQDQARPLLEQLQIRVPARVIFARGLGDHAMQGPTNVVRLPHVDNPLGGRAYRTYQLHLEDVPLPTPREFCVLGEGTKGYRLMLLRDGESQVLHEDSRLPTWRGCARHYRLSYVLAGPGALDVALISVFMDGFEGLARRFLAAPVPALGIRRGLSEGGEPER